MAVDDKDEVEDAMREALATEAPGVLDVRVTREENCYPMIPAGAADREMVGGVAPRRRTEVTNAHV